MTEHGPQIGPSLPTLHVLHVADRDVFARFGRMLRHVALALSEEGIQVSLLTDDPAAVADLAGTPIRCHQVGHLRGWRSWRPGRFLDRLLGPIPEIVHLWGMAGAGSVGHWALSRDLAVFVHALSSHEAQALTRWHSPSALYPLAACEGFARAGGKQSPVVGAGIRVVPPAFLMPDVPECTREPGHTLGVLWAGRIDERAGLGILIDAAAYLRRQHIDAQVVLLGAGPGTRQTWRRVHRAGVQDLVTLVHSPGAWDSAMHGVDIYVVPASQHELTLAPLLAMALGKVVIASRDQVAEWFVEDRTCWQFTPGSATELAYHLSRAAETPRLAGELGESAATYLREHHPIGPFTQRLVAMYWGAVARRDAGAQVPTRLSREQCP